MQSSTTGLPQNEQQSAQILPCTILSVTQKQRFSTAAYRCRLSLHADAAASGVRPRASNATWVPRPTNAGPACHTHARTPSNHVPSCLDPLLQARPTQPSLPIGRGSGSRRSSSTTTRAPRGPHWLASDPAPSDPDLTVRSRRNPIKRPQATQASHTGRPNPPPPYPPPPDSPWPPRRRPSRR